MAHFSGREDITSRCRRFDLLLFRRFGSICCCYDRSYRRSGYRSSDESLAFNRDRRLGSLIKLGLCLGWYGLLFPRSHSQLGISDLL